MIQSSIRGAFGAAKSFGGQALDILGKSDPPFTPDPRLLVFEKFSDPPPFISDMRVPTTLRRRVFSFRFSTKEGGRGGGVVNLQAPKAYRPKAPVKSWRFFNLENEVYLVKIAFASENFENFLPPAGYFSVQHL